MIFSVNLALVAACYAFYIAQGDSNDGAGAEVCVCVCVYVSACARQGLRACVWCILVFDGALPTITLAG